MVAFTAGPAGVFDIFLSLQMVRNRVSPVQTDEDLEWTFMINTSESHFHISSVWGNNFFLCIY